MVTRYYAASHGGEQLAWYEKWLEEIRTRGSNKPFSLEEYIELSLDIEIHETQTHKKYADIARQEGNPEVAAVFDELSNGEDYFSERLEKIVKESK